MNTGWFRINRKLFDNEIWQIKPFSKGQAWIDLIGGANHTDGSFFIRGNEIKIKRGEIGWSELTMTERWGWSRNKVRGFLAFLENRGQIGQQKIHKLTTTIRIINYDKYQNDTTDDTTERQQKDNRKYTNKNDNNEKNVKTLETVRAETFKNLESLTPVVIKNVADHYHVTFDAVQRLKDQMTLYCTSNGKSYKDYKSALMQWTMRRIEEGKIKPLQINGGSIAEILRKAGRNDIDL